ncbi:MAG: hypothetical protein ACLPWF_14505 [Bryobacteraceae bacterium]
MALLDLSRPSRLLHPLALLDPPCLSRPSDQPDLLRLWHLLDLLRLLRLLIQWHLLDLPDLLRLWHLLDLLDPLRLLIQWHLLDLLDLSRPLHRSRPLRQPDPQDPLGL